MSKKITLLGSTGSIGTQSLDVVRMQGYEVFGLSANTQVDMVLQQIAEFHPKYVCMANEAAADRLAAALAGQTGAPRVLRGAQGLRELAAMQGPDVVLNSVVGIAGLGASLAAIESGHDLALANKESLVTGGKLVTDAVAAHGVKLLPVDSEHSAIFPQRQIADQDPAHGLGRAFLWHDHRTAARQNPCGCAEAPQLEYGRQDHHRQRHLDEQGPGADRGGVAV